MTKARNPRKPRKRRSAGYKGPSAAARGRSADLLRGRLQNIVARLAIIESHLGIYVASADMAEVFEYHDSAGAEEE